MAVTQGFGVFGFILADPNIAVTINGKSVVLRTYFKPNPARLKCDSLQFINKDLFTFASYLQESSLLFSSCTRKHLVCQMIGIQIN